MKSVSSVFSGAGIALALLASPTAFADGGFYIGGSAGGATLDADLATALGTPISIDEDDTAIKVFAGYTFDLPVLDLSIEAGYVDFGEPEIDSLAAPVTLDTTGINAWGVAAIDTGIFDFYGKLGLIAWDVEASTAGFSVGDDGTDVGYGAGLRFDLGPIEVRGEYEFYDLDETDLSMLSVGIAYYFD